VSFVVNSLQSSLRSDLHPQAFGLSRGRRRLRGFSVTIGAGGMACATGPASWRNQARVCGAVKRRKRGRR